MNIKQPTVLTNLQRGNVKQENPALFQPRTIHELSAQGEIREVGLQVIDIVDVNGMTPLQWAAGYGQNSTVEFLLKSGADPNHRAKGGKTALMLAASKGFFHVVKVLIAEGARANEVDQFGNTALMYAAHQNHPQVIWELIKCGAEIGIVNIYKQNAYTLALSNHNKQAQAVIEAQLLSILKGSSLFSRASAPEGNPARTILGG